MPACASASCRISQHCRAPRNDGLFVIQPEGVDSFLSPPPVARLAGVSKVAEDKLKRRARPARESPAGNDLQPMTKPPWLVLSCSTLHRANYSNTVRLPSQEIHRAWTLRPLPSRIRAGKVRILCFRVGTARSAETTLVLVAAVGSTSVAVWSSKPHPTAFGRCSATLQTN
jgi:hypothetical protein